MKCLNCGFEGVEEQDRFCGECGTIIPTNNEMKWELPIWKWGSMIASFVLILIFWFTILENTYRDDYIFFWGMIGFPVTAYLMYKERMEKIKYKFGWILFPILTLFSFDPYYYSDREIAYIVFIIYIIPAILIDYIYINKLYKKR